MCTGRSRKRKEAHGGKNKSYNGAAVACSQTDTDTFGFPTALADCPYKPNRFTDTQQHRLKPLKPNHRATTLPQKNRRQEYLLCALFWVPFRPCATDRNPRGFKNAVRS